MVCLLSFRIRYLSHVCLSPRVKPYYYKTHYIMVLRSCYDVYMIVWNTLFHTIYIPLSNHCKIAAAHNIISSLLHYYYSTTLSFYVLLERIIDGVSTCQQPPFLWLKEDPTILVSRRFFVQFLFLSLKYLMLSRNDSFIGKIYQNSNYYNSSY